MDSQRPYAFDLAAALDHVVAERASDLHLSVGARPRVRIDGELRDAPWSAPAPFTNEALLGVLQPILPQEQRAALHSGGRDFDFAHQISDGNRFRVNVYFQRGRIGAVFRLIPTEILSLEQLGMPESVTRFVSLPRGLVLVTGPTGSGKSTTLAAMIDLANETRSAHIITLEDPIEFVHEHKRSIITQREIGEDTPNFGEGLRRVLRQDPDIILIGELRDAESVSIALTAAETGHLVFGTLHTRDAAQSIDRIIDTYPTEQQPQIRKQLANALEGVISQTLVRKKHGGRVAATEVLVGDAAVSNLLREGNTHQIASALQAGGAKGMHTLEQDLARLVLEGTISEASAREKIVDTVVFESIIRAGATRSGAALQGDADWLPSARTRVVGRLS